MDSSVKFRKTVAALGERAVDIGELFLAQVEFAQAFCRLRPRDAKAWRECIAKAWSIMERAVAKCELPALESALKRAQSAMAPIGKIAKTYTVHCVGHAHIDMNWLWSWPETVHVTNDTFGTMLKLMDEFPQFTFAQSQASVYHIIEQHNPAMLEAIRRRVREGRWEVTASHWVEGDKNLAGGEALARHLLYTRKYMKELLGLEAADVPIDWSPDTFGHAWTIPLVDSRGGVRRYYMCRGGVGWDKPPVFWWEAPDGSRILVNLSTTWYNDFIGAHIAQGMVNFCEQTALKDYLCVYGVGDHGGGPTRRDIRRIMELDACPIMPNVRCSTTGAYYSILEKNGSRWPTLKRELNYEFTGCYTSQSLIKKNNRLGEIHGVQAEWAALLGKRAAGLDVPAGKLQEIWRDVCFSHFHDILPGSGVAATRYHNEGTFQKVSAEASMIKTLSLRGIAQRVDTTMGGSIKLPKPPSPQRESLAQGAGVGRGTVIGGPSTSGPASGGPRPMVIFNPVAVARSEIVTATVWDMPADQEFVVVGPDGKKSLAQVLKRDEYWGHMFADIAFPVSVGPLGYALYVVQEADELPAAELEQLKEHAWRHGVHGENRIKGEQAALGGWRLLENRRLQVQLEPAGGGIAKFHDKAAGLDLAETASPMGVLEHVMERPGPMTAWMIQEAYKTMPMQVLGIDRRLGGPWIGEIAVKAKAGSSDVELLYRLTALSPYLEIQVNTRWLEIGRPEIGTPRLNMKFPLAMHAAGARYEIPFGLVDRGLDVTGEVPALQWAHVYGEGPGGQAAGFTLLNDSKHGHSLQDSTLRVTLLRSTSDPDPLPEVGEHTIRLGIAPHANAAADDLMYMGACFNQPLQVIAADVHGGDLGASGEALSVSGAVVTSVRPSQDGKAAIIHLLETTGKAAKAQVRIDPALLGRPSAVTEVDFLERPVAESTARLAGEGFAVSLGASAPCAVRVDFAE